MLNVKLVTILEMEIKLSLIAELKVLEIHFSQIVLRLVIVYIRQLLTPDH